MAARPRRLNRHQLTRRSPTRRGLLGLGAGAFLLAGCEDTRPARPATPGTGAAVAARRIRYGDDASQYVELRMPDRTPLATVVLLHGGYWLAGYGADQMHPMSEALSARGYATWNIEYRRIGSGGGFPQTFLDVAAAVDLIREQGLPEKVVLVGHSAGGHLAAWAASRTPRTPGGPCVVRPRGAISLSGVLDLTRAATTPGSASPVTQLMGGTPAVLASSYALADPALLAPAACPVAAVHAAADQVVPEVQASSYVAKARAAGGRAELVSVPGDHFTLIDPRSAAFSRIARLIDIFST